jgi:Protein of unknown function (DUF2442)
MKSSPKSSRSDDDSMSVSLLDGRTIAVPLALFPRLPEAAPEKGVQADLSSTGLHSDALDEEIFVATLLAAQRDATRRVSLFG